LPLIEKVSPASSQRLTVDGSDSVAYSSVPAKCSCWGTPSYNDLFRHSNGTLIPYTSSFSIYDLPLCIQSIALVKLKSPLGAFVHISYKKYSQHSYIHRSLLKSLPLNETVPPLFSHLTVSGATLLRLFFFHVLLKHSALSFLQKWWSTIGIIPISFLPVPRCPC
jgi:hypothetical protein